MPTSWNGETVLRLCIVNPRTSADDIARILRALEEPRWRLISCCATPASW